MNDDPHDLMRPHEPMHPHHGWRLYPYANPPRIEPDPNYTERAPEAAARAWLDEYVKAEPPTKSFVCPRCGRVHEGEGWQPASGCVNGVQQEFCIQVVSPPTELRTIHGPHAESAGPDIAVAVEYMRKFFAAIDSRNRWRTAALLLALLVIALAVRAMG